MTPERLDFIELRIIKNRSAFDLPELALEVIAELKKHLPPVSTEAVLVPPPVFTAPPSPVFDPETGLRNLKVEPDGSAALPAVTPPDAPKAKDTKAHGKKEK